VEGKHGKAEDVDNSESSGSSSGEEEDDEGFLASGVLDQQVNETLEAIRSKDPRVYDPHAKFYIGSDEDEDGQPELKTTEKPVYLKDYHREKLLRGYSVGEQDDTATTYVEQQDRLKEAIVREMHAKVDGRGSRSSSNNEDSDTGNDGFLVKKKVATDEPAKSAEAKISSADIKIADKDPESCGWNFFFRK
jgi:protein KRI1